MVNGPHLTKKLGWERQLSCHFEKNYKCLFVCLFVYFRIDIIILVQYYYNNADPTGQRHQKKIGRYLSGQATA